MSNQTQLYTHDAYGVTYADPSDPDFRVRFKTTQNRKSINGINVENYVNEIIVSDLHEVAMGNQTAVDTLAIRIRTSGSGLSQSRLGSILKSIASQLGDWTDENVLTGFEPVTLPLNPTE